MADGCGIVWLKEGSSIVGAGEKFDVRLTDNFKNGKFGDRVQSWPRRVEGRKGDRGAE